MCSESYIIGETRWQWLNSCVDACAYISGININASTRARQRELSLFLVFMLAVISSRWALAFSCAYASTYTCPYSVSHKCEPGLTLH